jgi:hypothetical protein
MRPRPEWWPLASTGLPTIQGPSAKPPADPDSESELRVPEDRLIYSARTNGAFGRFASCFLGGSGDSESEFESGPGASPSGLSSPARRVNPNLATR